MTTLPALVIGPTAVALLDQLMLRAGRAGPLPWRNGARRGRIPATGFEQSHATFSPGKQSELKERQSALPQRDDEEDGAPPHRSTVDLDGGVAVIRLPRHGDRAPLRSPGRPSDERAGPLVGTPRDLQPRGERGCPRSQRAATSGRSGESRSRTTTGPQRRAATVSTQATRPPVTSPISTSCG